jgi:hypothetical protein
VSRPNVEELRAVINELANAVQGAVGLAALIRQQTQAAADNTLALDAAIARAVAALKRLQPASRAAGGQ